MRLIIIIMFFCFSHSATAEVFKCIQSGKTIYSTSPCGDNAKPIDNHIMTVTGLSEGKIQEANPVPTPIQQKANPTVNTPSDNSTTLRPKFAWNSDCSNEEAAFDAVKKAMNAGYPATLSDYWHKTFVEARDAYDSCRERLQQAVKEQNTK